MSSNNIIGTIKVINPLNKSANIAIFLLLYKSVISPVMGDVNGGYKM